MTNKYFDFYEECLKNGYIDYTDTYQKQKINLLAKKHGLVEREDDFNQSSFDNAALAYKKATDQAQREQDIEKDEEYKAYVKALRQEEKEIISIVNKYKDRKGRYKTMAMCRDIYFKNKKKVSSINRTEIVEYALRKKAVVPPSITGGTIEGLTGSTILGLYGASERKRTNETNRYRNARIAQEIADTYYNQRITAESLVSSSERIYRNAELAYINDDILLARNIIINKLEIYISETGALRVFANLSMSNILGLPNNIHAYIDGTMKALIINRETQKVEEEVLMMLGYRGLRSGINVEGINPNTKITADNIDEYECELVDYELYAIEDRYAKYKSNELREFTSKAAIDYYYKTAVEAFDTHTTDGYMKALKYASYVDYDPKANKLKKEVEKQIAEELSQENKEKLLADQESTKRTISSLRLKKKEMKEEEFKLGFFARQKKKDLRNQISEIEKQIQTQENSLQIIETRISNVETLQQKINSVSNCKEQEEHDEEAPKKETHIYDIEDIEKAQEGDFILFGKYQQESDEKAPIEWEVLKIKSGQMMLISKFALEYCEFDNEYYGSKWEDCQLRKWLNTTFYDEAFSQEEKERITLTTITARKYEKIVLKKLRNPKNVYEDRKSKDKVFLLGLTEVKRYFHGKENLMCKATKYVAIKANSENENTANDNITDWWTTTTNTYYKHYGSASLSAGYIKTSGEIGFNDPANKKGIRPVLWVKI